MNYEIVENPLKIVVGVSAETANEDPKMGKIIGELWEKLLNSCGVYPLIQNKVDSKTIGLYSDYTQKGYTVTAGCEVSRSDNEGLTTKTIPAGQYAKFTFRETAVAECWKEVWNTPLDRSFTGDYEEYSTDAMKQVALNIYIALKG